MESDCSMPYAGYCREPWRYCEKVWATWRPEEQKNPEKHKKTKQNKKTHKNFKQTMTDNQFAYKKSFNRYVCFYAQGNDSIL